MFHEYWINLWKLLRIPVHITNNINLFFEVVFHSKIILSWFRCSSSSDPLLTPDTMTAASKELSSKLDTLKSDSNDIAKSAASNDDGIFGIVYSVLKKVAMVGAIYFVGYMGWSMAWLITPIMFSVTREQWKKSSQLKRDISILSAMSNERDVILAKITDLPAWVKYSLDHISRQCLNPIVFLQVYFPDVERCEWLNRVMQLEFISRIYLKNFYH